MKSTHPPDTRYSICHGVAEGEAESADSPHLPADDADNADKDPDL